MISRHAKDKRSANCLCPTSLVTEINNVHNIILFINNYNHFPKLGTGLKYRPVYWLSHPRGFLKPTFHRRSRQALLQGRCTRGLRYSLLGEGARSNNIRPTVRKLCTQGPRGAECILNFQGETQQFSASVNHHANY